MCLNPIYSKICPEFSNGIFVRNKIRPLSLDEIKSFKQNLNSVYNDNTIVTLPCRKCLECLTENSRMWTCRCLMESKLYKNNIFVTLTYEKSPYTLVSRDVVLFIKRLRKHFVGQKIRYFGCGEYGSKGKRPHFHLILFNLKLDDLKFFKFSGKNQKLYTSKTLEKLWGLGFVSVGEVNKVTIRYTTKYIQKMNIIPDLIVDDFIGEVVEFKKPYLFMSLKPGIGLNYFLKNYNGSDCIFLDGEKYSIPDYFLKFVDDETFMKIKSKNHFLKELRYKDFEQLKERRIFLENKLTKFSK